eukprot:5794981-Heterocapsa_arctica.AAC.1
MYRQVIKYMTKKQASHSQPVKTTSYFQLPCPRPCKAFSLGPQEQLPGESGHDTPTMPARPS